MPGGPSLYSALMAAAMGWDVTLVTTLSEHFDRTVFEGITVHSVPAASMPRYANSYDADGRRNQLLLTPGEPLTAELLACDEPQDAFLLAPAYHEVAAWPYPCARHRAVALQGILRAVNDAQRVSPRPDAFEAVAPFVQRGMFAFLSEEDTPEADELATALAESVSATVIVTRAERGATTFTATGRRDHPALSSRPLEPTGAGDCFSTAYLLRYAETNDTSEAIRFALAAGALAVEAPGLHGIPSRAAIERRLEMVAV